MLSGATTRTRRGTTLEMSNPESAIHDTPNRSLASTQEWCVPPATVRPGVGAARLVWRMHSMGGLQKPSTGGLTELAPGQESHLLW